MDKKISVQTGIESNDLPSTERDQPTMKTFIPTFGQRNVLIGNSFGMND